MTNPDEKIRVVYSDADTLSSFLNCGKFEFFMQVFERMDIEVIIPLKVKDELCRGRKRELRKAAIGQMIRTNRMKVHDFQDGEPEADTYYELSQRMGQGEAAALALAKNSKCRCVVASNNLSDVVIYAKENNIELWPTAEIMRKAYDMNVMTMEQANALWIQMKKDGLKLPRYDTYEDYYKREIQF